MTDVDAQWSVAGGMRPDHHAARIALVLSDILLQPVHRHREIAAAVIPVRARMALHDRGDHAVLRRPAPDVVVERIAFPNLLLDLVATAAGHEDEDWTVAATCVSHED